MSVFLLFIYCFVIINFESLSCSWKQKWPQLHTSTVTYWFIVTIIIVWHISTHHYIKGRSRWFSQFQQPMFLQLYTLVLFFDCLTTGCVPHLLGLPVVKDSWSSPRTSLTDLMLHLLYFVVLLKIDCPWTKRYWKLNNTYGKWCKSFQYSGKEIKCFFLYPKKISKQDLFCIIFVAFTQKVNFLGALLVLPTSMVLLSRRQRGYQIHWACSKTVLF